MRIADCDALQPTIGDAKSTLLSSFQRPLLGSD